MQSNVNAGNSQSPCSFMDAFCFDLVAFCIPFLVPSHRKKTGGLRTGNGSFPVGSDSSEKCGKTDGFGPEKQAKKGFSTVQTATYSF